jgi:hypothetical protein
MLGLFLALATGCRGGEERPAMERIGAGPDGRSFVKIPSGQPFVPWGFNYDRDHAHHLLEDYWDAEWERVVGDFQEMKALGATQVRVHLQFGKFMRAPGTPDPAALARLRKLVLFAERIDLYLDLTGLGNYRKKDSPAWYDAASEAERWAMQADFWDAVSSTCADSPAVFCYTLMNEPVSPAGPAKEWLPGEGLGGFHYVEVLTKDLAGRNRVDLTRQWIATLTKPIRKNDPRRMVTAGSFFLFEVPTGLTLGQEPKQALQGLDFASVHCYPKDGKVSALVDLLGTLKLGKPILIQEMFPMNCSFESFEAFVTGSRAHVSGWTGFYWGRSLEDMKGSKEPVDLLMTAWLTWFRDEAVRRKVAP